MLPHSFLIALAGGIFLFVFCSVLFCFKWKGKIRKGNYIWRQCLLFSKEAVLYHRSQQFRPVTGASDSDPANGLAGLVPWCVSELICLVPTCGWGISSSDRWRANRSPPTPLLHSALCLQPRPRAGCVSADRPALGERRLVEEEKSQRRVGSVFPPFSSRRSCGCLPPSWGLVSPRLRTKLKSGEFLRHFEQLLCGRQCFNYSSVSCHLMVLAAW